MTLYDKIKNMTVDEMAEYFRWRTCLKTDRSPEWCREFDTCKDCILYLLKQEETT